VSALARKELGTIAQLDNTIKTRLFRARAMLKQMLQKGGVAR